MKKSALILTILLLINSFAYANTTTYSEEGLFGLKNSNNEIILDAKYKKLIRLGDSAYIFQKGSKFGILDNRGKIIVEPKFNRAERILGKYAKLTKGSKCGLFDEKGFTVLPVEYNSIDMLFGGMLLTYKNYKYGLTDINGMLIVDNVFDDIYMPEPNTMILTYYGQQYEVKGVNSTELTIPFDMASISENENFTIKELVQKPGTTTGYYSITATNYLLKIVSSISTAYEETIDELMFLQGADAANTIMNFSWIPKFPVMYVRNYCEHLIAPNNGPLSKVKTNLKKQIKEEK